MLIANIRQPPSVAIIGGGVSGLVAGAALTAVGINATVFDTGENACGGRLSTRVVGAPGGGKWEFDHSTQVGLLAAPPQPAAVEGLALLGRPASSPLRGTSPPFACRSVSLREERSVPCIPLQKPLRPARASAPPCTLPRPVYDARRGPSYLCFPPSLERTMHTEAEDLT